MSEMTKNPTIVVRLPKSLGLTPRQVATLEQKWQQDLTDLVMGGADAHAKIKFHITIHIEIGND